MTAWIVVKGKEILAAFISIQLAQDYVKENFDQGDYDDVRILAIPFYGLNVNDRDYEVDFLHDSL